jgi:signal peptidase I
MVKLRAKYVREYFWQTRIRKIVSWVVQIGLAILLALFCAFSFGQRVIITESSMEPFFEVGDKVLYNSLIYNISSPQRGDVVVFDNGSDPESNAGMHVRRVIGMPGETILIKDGNIYIDGELYVEEVNYGIIDNPGIADEPVELENDEYFVLGDNRNNSEDSRHMDIGPVQKDKIKGKLWFRYAPGSRIGIVG